MFKMRKDIGLLVDGCGFFVCFLLFKALEHENRSDSSCSKKVKEHNGHAVILQQLLKNILGQIWEWFRDFFH